MPDTLTGLVMLLVFLLPGFILVQASKRDKLYKPRSDLDFVLRGLTCSLIVHLIFFPWTSRVFHEVEHRASTENQARLVGVQNAAPASKDALAAYSPAVSAIDVWPDEKWELLAYGLVVIAVAPITIGTLLGRYLRGLEFAGGALPWWGDLLGVGTVAPPRAWDALPSQLGAGGWIVVRLRESGNVIGGKCATRSMVNLGADPDVLIEELWWLDEYGNPLQAIVPQRAAWVSRDRIESLVVLPAPSPEPAAAAPAS
jgi:hypothetical protein